MPAPRTLSRLVHLLLPPLCVHCDEPLRDARPGVCRWCRATLRPLGPGCRRCALPRPGEPAGCDRCRGWPAGLDAVAAVRYGGAAESIVHALKYSGWSHLAELCADAMASALADRGSGLEVLAAVPLHPARSRERGFNQSVLLAAALADRLRIPSADPLVRVRATRSQVGLGRAARGRNVEGAFAACGIRPGAALGLVDDVATSGATIAAAAAALFDAGAARVTAITFALATSAG